MRHFAYLLIITGAFMATACSTNETMDEAGQDSATEAAPAAETTAPAAAESQAPAESATEEPAAPAAAESQAPATTTSSSDGSGITYVCTHDSSTRTIRVIYPDSGPNVCEVTYEKSTGTQTLWSASNDESYCTGKAEGFVAKQEGWGWECSKQ
jgi:hypothetical protein